jgi:hypothetical protein
MMIRMQMMLTTRKGIQAGGILSLLLECCSNL